MRPLALIFIGLVAAGATLISVTTDNDDIAIISGIIGSLSWFLFAYSSLSITTFEGGTAHTTRYPALAVWGVAMAVPDVIVALTGPLEIINDRDQLREEVQ